MIVRPDGGLAAAAFADEAERLAFLDVERDVVDRLDVSDRALEQAAAHREVLHEVAHGDERLGWRLWCRARFGDDKVVSLTWRSPFYVIASRASS